MTQNFFRSFFSLSLLLAITAMIAGCNLSSPSKIDSYDIRGQQTSTENENANNKGDTSKDPKPQPTPTPPRIATKIFCQTSPYTSARLSLFTSDASDKFVPRFYSVRDLNNNDYEKLLSPIGLFSEGEKTSLIVLDRSTQGLTNVISTEQNVLTTSSRGMLVHSFPTRENAIENLLRTDGAKSSPVLMMRDLALWLTPAAKDPRYELKDRASQTTVGFIELNPADYTPVSASKDGNWSAWLSLKKQKSLITLVDLKTFAISTLAPTSPENEQRSPIFVDQENLVWVEIGKDEVAKRTFKILQKNVINQQQSVIYVGAGDEAPVVTAWRNSRGALQFLTYRSNALIYTGLDGRVYEQELPQNLIDLAKKEKQTYTLVGAEYANWMQKVYLFTGQVGGLMSFNPNTSLLSQHGNFFNEMSCHQPALVPDISTPARGAK